MAAAAIQFRSMRQAVVVVVAAVLVRNTTMRMTGRTMSSIESRTTLYRLPLAMPIADRRNLRIGIEIGIEIDIHREARRTVPTSRLSLRQGLERVSEMPLSDTAIRMPISINETATITTNTSSTITNTNNNSRRRLHLHRRTCTRAKHDRQMMVSERILDKQARMRQVTSWRDSRRARTSWQPCNIRTCEAHKSSRLPLAPHGTGKPMSAEISGINVNHAISVTVASNEINGNNGSNVIDLANPSGIEGAWLIATGIIVDRAVVILARNNVDTCHHSSSSNNNYRHLLLQHRLPTTTTNRHNHRRWIRRQRRRTSALMIRTEALRCMTRSAVTGSASANANANANERGIENTSATSAILLPWRHNKQQRRRVTQAHAGASDVGTSQALLRLSRRVWAATAIQCQTLANASVIGPPAMHNPPAAPLPRRRTMSRTASDEVGVVEIRIVGRLIEWCH